MRVGQLTDKASQEMMIALGVLTVVFAVFLYARTGQLAEAAFNADMEIVDL